MTLSGVTILVMARITERRNLWNWLPDFPKLALIATRLLSMHTTARASERNWSKCDLMFAENHAKLSIDVHLELPSENVLTALSEAEMLDLSLEDDD